MGVTLEQLGPETIDQEHDVGPAGREGQRGGLLVERVAERCRHGRKHVDQRSCMVGRLDEAGPGQRDQAGRVSAESDSAKSSMLPTASSPSAAADTRSEKSSEAKDPV